MKSLSASPRAEPKWMGEAGILEGISKVLRERSGDESPEHVAGDKGLDTVIGPAQCHNAPELDGSKHWLRDIGVCQSLCSLAEERAMSRLTEEQAQAPAGCSGGACGRPPTCSEYARPLK